VPVGETRPRILGMHLEGPFLSPNRLGTHEASSRRDPDPELLGRLLDAGPVRLMTLAPELPGALELIDRLHERGVTVSLGHSDATAAQANAAFDRGACSVTHIFNAMRPFLHRDPGIAGAALARDDVIVAMILDGIHLAPETAQVVCRAARGRLALVTDAIAATPRAADGPTSLGELDLLVHEGTVRGPDGVLAGSVLTMIEAVRNLHALGCPLEECLDAATSTPARVLGDPQLGRIAVGGPADIVVLDDRLEIERVLVAGELRVVV
jgi:N-acetylglucosamine-6-phosphate deacetylase